MNVWLVTLGSSDVQIRDTDLWSGWYREVKRSLYGIDHSRFKPTRIDEDDDAPYRIASRVLEIAYEQLGEAVTEQLVFPLLEQFQRKLLDKAETIDRIVVLTSDQQHVFGEEERERYRCPYWQDTGLLYPIVCDYLQSSFPNAQISSLSISPHSSDQGLDDWDAGLKLVRREIASLDFKPEKVYVSHQAGTPAISSAVQFSSLAKFGQQVEFLVSSEYRPERTRLIDSSEYLSALRLQEAKALLDRYDYSGVQQLLCANRKVDSNLGLEEINCLLTMAIQWNFAKFEDFGKARGDLARERLNQWWWIGYEAAYLGVVRFEQKNTVEALFHSFRSIEGLISMWAESRYYPDHININPKNGSLDLKISILDVFEDFLGNPKQGKMRCELEEKKKIGLYSFPLYELLRRTKPEWREDPHIATVWNTAAPKRNDLFHRLRGLYEIDVFEAWNTQDEEAWKSRVLGCLNFISGQDFKSLKEASLMSQVHAELKTAIENL